MKKKEVFDQNGYKFFKLGSGWHGAYTKIWVSKPLLEELKKNNKYVNDQIEFPIKNATIVETEKGGYVIRPGSNTVMAYTTNCGYRGCANIEKFDSEPIKVVKKEVYSSPCGSLGEDYEYLIEFNTPKIRFLVYRTGRRVERNEIYVIITESGKIIEDLDPSVDPALME